MSVPLKDKIDDDAFESIVSKDWKIANLDEEVIKNIRKRAKVDINSNSLRNLAQFNKRSEEGKRKTLSKLRVPRSNEINVEPIDISVLDDDVKKMISTLVPISGIFDPNEERIFSNFLSIFLKDFRISDLTNFDIDDILQLATNKVLEIRLLTAWKDKPSEASYHSQSIEKLRKQNDKMKESLAARRKDRVVPKDRDNISIVDIAASFDIDKMKELEERESLLYQEEQDFLKSREFKGNRFDEDVLMELEE